MNNSSSKITAQTFVNQRYMTISVDEATNDDYDLHQYDNRQRSDNFKANVPSSERQPIKQFEYHKNQNQRPPPRQVQFLPKTSMEGSASNISSTQSITTFKANEASSVQEKPQNQQHESVGQRSARGGNKKQKKKDNIPRDQIQKNIIAVPNKELSSEHLGALKNTFDNICHKHFLSKTDHDQHLSIYHHLRDIIRCKRPDAQITLYGSLSFECCLKEANIIDIDIQFNETLPYEALKELLNIVRSSVYCKEPQINVDREPLSIDFFMTNSKIPVRLTSENTRAVHLSELIQIYLKFDKRVLPLLRLFRILSKICNMDRPDLGIVHPVVFYIMVIHFLQQLDPPVLPCLHEYVFGIDKSPIALNNDQYPDFVRVCRVYGNRWKSNNTTSVEMLFIQLLSYYVGRFNLTRFIVSIQTRMPILKNENQIFNRKLFCIDPTSFKQSLSYAMKASCSCNYFRRTLTKALNYFSREQNPMNQTEDLDITTTENDENTSVKSVVEGIHKSYTLFIERFPKQIHQWRNISQEDIRQYYKQTFDEIRNPLPKPILKLNENNISQLYEEIDDEEKVQEVSPDDLQITSTTMNSNEDDQRENNQVMEQNDIIVDHKTNDEQTILSSDELQSSFDKEEEDLILFEILSKDLSESQKEILHKEYHQQGDKASLE